MFLVCSLHVQENARKMFVRLYTCVCVIIPRAHRRRVARQRWLNTGAPRLGRWISVDSLAETVAQLRGKVLPNSGRGSGDGLGL